MRVLVMVDLGVRLMPWNSGSARAGGDVGWLRATNGHSGTRFARRRRLILAVGPRDVCVVGNTSTPAHLEYRSRRPVPGTEATSTRAPSLVRIGRSVTYERRPVAQVGVGGRVFVRSHLIRRGAVFGSLRRRSRSDIAHWVQCRGSPIVVPPDASPPCHGR